MRHGEGMRHDEDEVHDGWPHGDVNEHDRLVALAAWADRFAAPGFTMGTWAPSVKDPDGVIHLGWFELSADALQFIGEMAGLGWVYPFDWMAWLASPAGSRLRTPEAVADASSEDLAKLLTAIVRGERFADGQLAGAYESGLLLAIARRAGELAGRS